MLRNEDSASGSIIAVSGKLWVDSYDTLGSICTPSSQRELYVKSQEQYLLQFTEVN